MINWIKKSLELFNLFLLPTALISEQKLEKHTSDAYWLARMEREILELQKANTTKSSSKPKEKIIMVNAEEGKGCVIEPKTITIIEKLF